MYVADAFLEVLVSLILNPFERISIPTTPSAAVYSLSDTLPKIILLLTLNLFLSPSNKSQCAFPDWLLLEHLIKINLGLNPVMITGPSLELFPV